MSQLTHIKRFAISDSAPDLTGSGTQYHCRNWGGLYVTRIHGEEECVLDLASRQDLKDAHNFALLSDHKATPAEKSHPRLRAHLQEQGITSQPGDMLLNQLRALRDKFESISPNPYGFDIS